MAENKIQGERQNLKGYSFWKEAFKRLKKNRPAMIGLFMIIIFSIIAVSAPLLSPADPIKQDLDNRLRPAGAPSRISRNGVYLLGSDEFGRDIFSRVLYGARISMSVGIISQILVTLIGVSMGSLAGYYGGKIDMVIMRLADILFAFPSLLFYIGVMFALGPSIYNIFIALALIGWAGMARLVRSQVISIKEMEFIEAARAQGLSDARIILKHILPNCIGPIIVSVTLGIPTAILAEASLSFLGLGVQPPTPSWGNMIYAARAYIRSNPMYSVWPGIAIMVMVFSFNLLGDGLRDALDPKLKR
ncbi:Dipeptide transport system permease protein DppC [Koleobacter methoxysyntrophicus]|uniref:Dipeptide transport system permease protein DppC n=1 Tax=Koleobacter methoxysyntrophicus TaxID=2751313 RepID=A0A8A0RKF0_9FIRM|nr:ABC transporter permease [Koleobacter methoxysyntrophicus]QSQ08352.1 Dipeptide transport system permease protein DppC [Koleobacter methoxysyntrophicus]